MKKELYAFPGVTRIAIRRRRGKIRSNTESYGESLHFTSRVGVAKSSEFGKRFPNFRAPLLIRVQPPLNQCINQCID
jgi:hypothetical protein